MPDDCKLVFTFSFTFEGDNNSGDSTLLILTLLTLGKRVFLGTVFVSEVRSFLKFEFLARLFTAALGDDSLTFCCDVRGFSCCFMSLLGECLAFLSKDKFSGLCTEECPTLSDAAGGSCGVDWECCIGELDASSSSAQSSSIVEERTSVLGEANLHTVFDRGD
jgi:hypothetical protein